MPWTSGGPFPRAEVIQDLTLFSSYLGNYFDAHDPCYNIAQKGSKAMRQVINRVLTQDVPQSQPPNDSPFVGVPMEDGMDFITWIDTIDWGQEMMLNN